MILVTRLNGATFALNPDLIERAENTPDTVVTLTNGRRYDLAESIPELIDLIGCYRATLIAKSQDSTVPARVPAGPPVLTLHRGEDQR